MKKSVRKIVKWSVISITGLIISVVLLGVWFMNLIPKFDQSIKQTTLNDLPYLSENIVPKRGKILAVVTSTNIMGSSNKATGYELTELSRAYYVFQANGFEVDVASPLGGEPPVIIDNDDMGAYDYAFMNDPEAQRKTRNTIPIADVNPEDYQAIYFVGGKGAMYDFPDNEHIQSIVQKYYESDKVIGAVCHGPAALVNVKLENGQSLLENKVITSFTNEEELFLIPDAKVIFPFLLQAKLEDNGALFNDGIMYLENVSHDGNLVTGQNPWSTWKLAETMIQQLGYTPKFRIITSEELAIQVLNSFEKEGYSHTKKMIDEFYSATSGEVDRTLIAMHGIVAGMQWKIGKSIGLIRLVSYIKTKSEE
ncbi:type 1 glutamine amidotransferase domain-containing protein [Ekhidna sp.]